MLSLNRRSIHRCLLFCLTLLAHKCFFLSLRPLFHECFTLQGFALRCAFFDVDESHWKPRACVLRSTPRVMRLLTLRGIGARACIERAVVTPCEVEEVGHTFIVPMLGCKCQSERWQLIVICAIILGNTNISISQKNDLSPPAHSDDARTSGMRCTYGSVFHC